MKHKHADLIHAWADGAKIQSRKVGVTDWRDIHNPEWYKDFEYRIKPEEKIPVVRWLWAIKWEDTDLWRGLNDWFTDDEIKQTNYKEPLFKLEWSRTEFPE